MTDLTDEQRARALELRNVWADALGASTAAALPAHQSKAWLVMEDHVLKSHTCKPAWRSVTRNEIKAGWEIRSRYPDGKEAMWGVAHYQDDVDGDWLTEAGVLLTHDVWGRTCETTAPVKSDTGIDVEEVEVKEQPRRIHMLELVKEALDIVNGPRQDTYGNPADSFQQIADFWEAYLKRKAPGPITPKDVSRMMQLMKISRGATGVEHKDNLIDKIGYILLEAVI